jgi:protocatechuate 3,4-dioxygenase, alpha subunit
MPTRAGASAESAPADDPLPSALPWSRRATFPAAPDVDRVHRFDTGLRYDGEHEETVFLEFG